MDRSLKIIFNESKHDYPDRIRWTCCNQCHVEHKTIAEAKKHYDELIRLNNEAQR